jgi:hypothetical protein
VCITPQWLADSIAHGWCQDERPYSVDPENPGHPLSLTNLSNRATLPEATATATLPGSNKPAFEVSFAANASLAARGSQGTSGSGEAGGAAPTESERLVSRPDSATAFTELPVGGAQHGAGLAPPEAPQFVWDDLDWDDGIPPFLDACRVWSVGCLPAETFEVIKGTRQGAAKRFIEPVFGLTHIIVGSDLSPAEAADLAKVCSWYACC